MEGLEAAEVSFSNLNDEFRYEAQYFLKKYLAEDSALERSETVRLGDLAYITDGPHGYHELDDSSPVHMLTAKCAKNWKATSTGADRISAATHRANLRSSLEVNDLILSTRGTVGLCALVGNDVLPANIDQDVARIHLNSKSKSRAHFLCAYLNSSFGQDHINRVASGMVQQGLSLQKVREIPIPVLSETFTGSIEQITKSALKKSADSLSLIRESENSLLKSLGLKNWQPPTPLTYEQTASTVISGGRFDAEFFHPRIEDLFNRLGDREETVGSVATLRAEKFKGTSASFNYLEIGAVTTDGVVTDSIIDGVDAPSRATWYVHHRDIVTSTVRPIRGLTAMIEENQSGAVASSGFAVLEPTKVSSELLLCYLKLPLICELMDLHTSASMYPAISVPDILNLPFKYPGEVVEKEVIELVQEARAKKRQSQALLERAKRAVEIAIEQDEATALAYLDGKHYVADELIPKLFGPSRHYVDLNSIQRTLEAEAIHYEPTTIKRYLQEWQNEGRIHDAGRGWYTDLPDAWSVDAKTEPVRSIVDMLSTEFPLLDYTVWSTRELAPFFQHLPSRHATFLMVDRDAFDPVAQALRDKEMRVVVHPLGEIAKAFVLDAPDTVVLRPRLSSDHVACRAPIEQTLVDLFYEIQKLGLFDGQEFENVVRNVGSTFRLNLTAMKRYAQRRKIDAAEILGAVI